MRQDPSETSDDFVTNLKSIAAKCKFRDDKEMQDRIVDQLIWGSAYKDVHKVLIGRDETLSLNAAIDVARSHEATTNQLKSLQEKAHIPQSATQEVSINEIKPKESGRNQRQKKCYNCGRVHPFKPKTNCPAYGSTCNKCGKDNHWKSVCGSGKQQQRNPHSKSPRRRVHYV